MTPRIAMKHLKTRVAKTLVLISILGIGSVATIKKLVDDDMQDYQRSGGISWGYDFSNESYGGTPVTWSSHDMILNQTRDFWQTSRLQSSIGYVDNVRSLNPDCIFLAYYPFDNVYNFQKQQYENYTSTELVHDPVDYGELDITTLSDAIVEYGPGNFDYDIWKLFVDNPTWLARTNGIDPATSLPDTFSSYRRNYFYNITIQECREAVADLLIRDYYASPDIAYKPGIGILIDYLQTTIYDEKPDGGPADLNETGELDLDQDGNSYWDDADERAAWVEASIAQVEYIRSKMPAGFLIISNGQSADSYDEYTKLLDGVMFENFPRYHWGFPVGVENYYAALSRNVAHSLFKTQAKSWITQNGGPYLILENSYGENEVAVASTLFDNTYCVWRTEDTDLRQYAAERLDLSFLGAPLDTTITVTLDDYNWIHNRQFENGSVSVRITSIGEEISNLAYRVIDGEDIVYQNGSLDPTLPPDTPICYIEPTTLSFSVAAPGDSETKTITVSNIGTGVLSVYMGSDEGKQFLTNVSETYPPYGVNPVDLEHGESVIIEITYTAEDYDENIEATWLDQGSLLPSSPSPPFYPITGELCDERVRLIGVSAESPTSIYDWTFSDNWNGPEADYMSTMTKHEDFPLVQPNDYWFWHQVDSDQYDPYFDPNHERQWWLDENHMNAERAWAVATGDSTTGVLSAIVDAYPNSMHDDFKQRLFWNSYEAPGGINGGADGVDDDGNGYIDDYYGWNWAVNQSIPQRNKPWFGREDITSVNRWKMFHDNSGNNDNLHGSSMLGIFAATTNNEEWWLIDPSAPITADNDNRVDPERGLYNAGIASLSWNTKVMPCTFYYTIPDGASWYSASVSDLPSRLTSSLRYITDLKVNHGYDFRVVSYSTGPFSTEFKLAVIDATMAGILVVGGAGNDNLNDVYDLASMRETVGVGCSDFNSVRLNKGTGSVPGSNWGEELSAMGYGSDGTNTVNWGEYCPPSVSYSNWSPITKDFIASFGAVQTMWCSVPDIFPTFDIVGNDSTPSLNGYVYSGITTTDALTSGATAQAASLAVLVAAASEENNWNDGEPLTPNQIIYMISRGSLNIDSENIGNCGGEDCDGLLGSGRMDAYTTLTLWGTVPRDTTLTGNIFISGDLKIPSGVDVVISPGSTVYIALDNILENVSGYDTIRPLLVDITVEGTLDLRGANGNPVTLTSWTKDSEIPTNGDWGKIIGTYVSNSYTIIEGDTK